jgi:hypothetical protein
MTTIGVHTHITNPFSSGYLVYLATIESWARVADELVVIDGGTTDNSIQLLRDWLGPLATRIRILTPPLASWAPGRNWCWSQIAINRQLGLEALTTDWAIHVDADHVLHHSVTRSQLDQQLQQIAQNLVANYWVSGHKSGTYFHRMDTRTWIVNKKRMAETENTVSYGLDEKYQMNLDYPIQPDKRYAFLDPTTSQVKEFCMGPLARPACTVEIDSVKYGHFFFTLDQCFYKCQRISNVMARHIGRAPDTVLETMLLAGLLPGCIGKQSLSLANILRMEHPQSVERLLTTFYHPDMIGGSLPNQQIPSFMRHLYRASTTQNLTKVFRMLRSRMLRVRGYRGLLDLYQPSPVDETPPVPLDIRAVYRQQDAFLPPAQRIG